MNQTEFAAFLGLEFHQYNRYERQAIQPTLEKALTIARRLNKPVEEIFYLDSPGD
jgi:DNA-binding XRE family transcriptional regulator